jgi:hypothetical protein
MAGTRLWRNVSAAMGIVLVAATTIGLAGSASAGSRPAAPTDLEATAYSGAVHLTWQPGSDDPDVTYRMHNLTLGWTSDSAATSGRWGHSLKTGTTYTFEVTAIDGERESAPSNRVSVTIPALGPPIDVDAVLDGDVVKLSWERPAELEPGSFTIYSVQLNGVLERRVTTNDDSVQTTIPRVNPGTTHSYTVRALRAPESEAALVTVPPSDDVTPPTTPTVNLGFSEGCTSVIAKFVEESTDDTTPPSEIRYEALRRDRRTGEFFVAHYDIPRAGALELINPEAFRAVDEAGNRSGIAVAGFDPDC